MATFNGNEGMQIKIAEGAIFTAAFRLEFHNQPKGIFFGANHLQTILKQPDCKGIRVYFGSVAGKLTLVLVGADTNTNDQLDYILDAGVLCPPTCGNTNPLNL